MCSRSSYQAKVSLSPAVTAVLTQINCLEYCTHASVVDGQVTSFVACPSNDMLMTYDNVTTDDIGQRAEAWT
jgi:hypothetical protein